MKINTVFLFLLVCCVSSYAQNQSAWKKVSQGTVSESDKRTFKSDSDREMLFQFDDSVFKSELIASQNNTGKNKKIEISIPNTEGILEKFIVWEASNFEPELQEKYPDIKSYAGRGITDSNATLYFSFSKKGIQTMVLRIGGESEFIEKYPEDRSLYKVFSAKGRVKGKLPFICTTEEKNLNKELLNNTAKIASNNKSFKTLRLALSCTGEYAVYHGGTEADAMDAMNATMTRVNGIFNRDLAVRLILIANNNLVIYTNASTDPYSDASVGVGDGSTPGPWSQELQGNLDNVIGSANYDIGHLFGASGGGGNAACIGCVCGSGKGSAYTSPADDKPEGDSFDIDFVAHEMGHQLGAAHTFSHFIEGTGVSVEPGSGSTIMGYAGVTTYYDVQAHSDDYFSYASINQIQNNLAGKSCPVSIPITTNSPPIVNAGSDYTIPKGTAFVLKGSGSDPDGDTITYTWEQSDSAVNGENEGSIAFPTKTNGPLFRSLSPSNSPVRYMPNYNDVLANRLTNRWESVSNVARVLHFILTARDNAVLEGAQTNFDEMIVDVSGTVGPFVVTSQNTDGLSWFQGERQTITWDVNNTNTLSGSSAVNIKLSTDGGLTFPINLALNTPNDGSERIIVPNVDAAKYCRILIEPTDNIYYALNSKDFAIGYDVNFTCNTYNFSAPFQIPESTTYATRTINFPPTTAIVSDVNLKVAFMHTYLSDIEMDIISPKGTTVKLFDKNCGDTDGSLLINYDDNGGDFICGSSALQTVAPVNIVPFQFLASFNEEDPSGSWKLRVRDVYPEDTGTLNSASITICTKSFTLVPYSVNNYEFTTTPNPNEGVFTVKFTSKSPSEKIKVFVYDILGKVLFAEEYPNVGDFVQEIELPNKPQTGVYFVRLTDGQVEKVSKILIK